MNCKGLKELLEAFVEKDCEESEYPSELDSLLSDTAKTGVVKFSWPLLKPLLKFRLESILNSETFTKCLEDDKELPKQLSQRLDTFENPPFTIQRLCELVVNPRKHYKRKDKYMRAMEKNLMVVGTQEPDLTWMNSPRLQGEPAAVIPHGQPNHNHTLNHTSGYTENADLAELSTSSLPSDVRKDSTVLSTPDNTAGGQEVGAHPSSPMSMPRKRSSSLRDSMESNGGGRGIEEESMVPVLQEADSTTIEHCGSSHLLDADQAAQKQCLTSAAKQGEDQPVGGTPTMWEKGEEPVVAKEDIEEQCVKKMRYRDVVEAREDGEGLRREMGGAGGGGGGDESDVSSGGGEEGEEGGGEEEQEGEATQRKETYKEAATGQLELGTEGSDLLLPGGMETS